MNCNLNQEYMMKYLESSANDIESAQFKQHLKTCISCKKEFEEMEKVFEVLNAREIVEPPQNFEAGIMSKIRNFESVKKKVKDTRIAFMYMGGTIILTILFMLIFVNAKGFQSAKISELPEILSDGMIILYNLLEIPGSFIVDTIEFLLKSMDIILKAYYYTSVVFFIVIMLSLISYKILDVLNRPIFASNVNIKEDYAGAKDKEE